MNIFTLTGKILVDSKKAEDSISKTESKAGKFASSLGKGIATVGKWGLAAGTAAVTAAVAFGKTAVEAANIQENAEKRLESIAKSVAGASDAQIQKYKEQAAAIQQVTTVGDEAIIQGQSQLQSFTKSTEVVGILTQSMTDLAVAQYGASVSGDQMQQTGNLVGKMLAGQLGAATKAGILVSDDLKAAFEAATTEEERAIVVNQILQENYGGLAESMAKTSEGAMLNMKNRLSDINEKFGAKIQSVLVEKILPKLIDMIDKVLPLVTKLVETIIDKLPVMADMIQPIFDALLPLLPILIDATLMIFDALLPLLPLIAQLIAELLPPLIQLIMPIIQLTTQILSKILPPLIKLTGILAVAIADNLSKAFEDIAPLIDGAITLFMGLIEFVTAVFTGDWEMAWQGIKNIFIGIWEVIKNTAILYTDAIIEKVNWIIEKINSLLNVSIPTITKLGDIANNSSNTLQPSDPGYHGESSGTVASSSIYKREIPQNAKGTDNWEGGWTIAGEDPRTGENGELINLPKGTKIYDNKKSREMLGGNTYIFHTNKTSAFDLMREAREKERLAYLGALK